MNADNPPPCRRRHLRVPVRPDEDHAIRELAAQAGLPVAAYLRNVGMGYRLHSMLDHKMVEELAGLHGDLGRLAHQLQLSLADARDDDVGALSVRTLLGKIEASQRAVLCVMQTVARAGNWPGIF